MFEPFEPREHGDAIARSARPSPVQAGPMVDFSVNLNPYGPSPTVLRAAQEADYSAYPESSGRVAREAWASQLGCEPDALVLGHGAAELLWHLARLVLRPGDRFGLLAPTFSEAEAAARAAGAEVLVLRARAQDGFRHVLTQLADPLSRCRLAYVCTPNNPTGHHVAADDIAALARACPDTLFAVDQSFLALSDHAAELRAACEPNVVYVRSLTKEHCLAGLRVGYARCRPELARALETRRASWPTSAPAQAAMTQAAQEQAFVERCWQRMKRDRDALCQGLQGLGLLPLPSATSFVLVPVPRRAQLGEQLSQHGIAVRDCSSFGLPEHLRLAARPETDRTRLLAALREVLR